MTIEVHAKSAGFVSSIDAREIGIAALAMGAGASRAEDTVDPAVGIEIARQARRSHRARRPPRPSSRASPLPADCIAGARCVLASPPAPPA